MPLSVFVVHFHQSFMGCNIWYMNNKNAWKFCEKFTKHKVVSILSQKGCNSSNGVSFNQLYILWVELGKNLVLFVIKPQTINNNKNETLWKHATYPSDHKFNCSKFLQILLLHETLNRMNNNKTKIKHEWINMFNHNVGSNPQDKWTITFFKKKLKCHSKVLHLNEIPNI